MSNDYRDYRRPGSDDGYRRSNTYRKGITTYERPHGVRGRRNSPYRRSNMIYAKKRRRWPAVLAVIAVIAAIAGIVFFACSAGGNEGGQQAQTEQQEQGAQEGQDGAAADGQQGDAEGSADAQQDGQQDGGQAAQVATGEDRRSQESDSRNDVKPDEKVVYLTFDDGPSPNTHKIMDILDKEGIKATWFVIGVSGHLEYVKDLWDAGHQLALHTNSHEYDKVYASTDAFWDEIDTIAKKVEEYVGFKPTLFRFPGGSVNDYNTAISVDLRQQSYERGYHYFDWNVSSSDAASNKRTKEQILKSIKKESKDCHSCCVLMHDTEAKGTTVEALPEIIEYYKSQGFTFDVLNADSFGYHFQND